MTDSKPDWADEEAGRIDQEFVTVDWNDLWPSSEKQWGTVYLAVNHSGNGWIPFSDRQMAIACAKYRTEHAVIRYPDLTPDHPGVHRPTRAGQ